MRPGAGLDAPQNWFGREDRFGQGRFVSNLWGVALAVSGASISLCSSGGKALLRQSGRSHSGQDRPMPARDSDRPQIERNNGCGLYHEMTYIQVFS